MHLFVKSLEQRNYASFHLTKLNVSKYLDSTRTHIWFISGKKRVCLQKKFYTSLNRGKIKSNKGRIDLKTGNKAEIRYNYFGVNDMIIGSILQFLQQFIAKHQEDQSCN